MAREDIDRQLEECIRLFHELDASIKKLRALEDRHGLCQDDWHWCVKEKKNRKKHKPPTGRITRGKIYASGAHTVSSDISAVMRVIRKREEKKKKNG